MRLIPENAISEISASMDFMGAASDVSTIWALMLLIANLLFTEPRISESKLMPSPFGK